MSGTKHCVRLWLFYFALLSSPETEKAKDKSLALTFLALALTFLALTFPNLLLAQSLQRIVFAVFHHLNQNWSLHPINDFTHNS